MSNGEIEVVTEAGQTAGQREGVRVRLPSPPHQASMVAWLLGRAFNELRYRLQVERLTSSDPDPDRTAVVWAMCSHLVDHLEPREVAAEILARIRSCRTDWEADQPSEWMSERIAELNRILNGEERPNNFESETDLLNALAEEAVEFLSRVRDSLSTACRDQAASFEAGGLADQLIHPPVNSSIVAWSFDAIAEDGMSHHDPSRNSTAAEGRSLWVLERTRPPILPWRVPTGIVVRDGSWPDAEWFFLMTAHLQSITADAGAIERRDLNEQLRIELLIEIETSVFNMLQDIEGESPEVHNRFGVEIMGNRIRRRGHGEVELRGRIGLNMLRAFLQHSNRTFSREDLETSWQEWGGTSDPEYETITSALTRLNRDILCLGIEIRSVGKCLGRRLQLID